MVACFPQIPKREVVLMEDDSLIKNEVKNLLKEDLDCHVIEIENKQQAIELASKQESLFFILDVHMGQTRQQEGLDTLEEIKTINSNSPVFILSSYQQYKRWAENLNADGFIQKETDLQQVIRSKIEPEILKYELKVLEAREQETCRQLEELQKKAAPNIQAYENLMKRQDFLDEYQDQYVAFLGGEFVDSDKDKTKLLERLQQNHPDKSCFFKQVKKEKDYVIIDLPYYDIV